MIAAPVAPSISKRRRHGSGFVDGGPLDLKHPSRSSRFRPAHAAGRVAERAGIWPIPSAMSGMTCSCLSSGGNRG
jgi:hypothetical protein